MKSRNIIITVLLSALVCMLAVGSNSIARSGKKISPAKLAVVDMETVIMKSKKNELFESAFKEYAAKAQKEIKDIDDEINLLRDSLTAIKPTSEDYGKRASALMEKEMLLEVKRKYYQQDLPMRRQRFIEMALVSVADVIEKIAKAEGYDIVIPKEGRKVLYSADELDITEEVLEAWNATK